MVVGGAWASASSLTKVCVGQVVAVGVASVGEVLSGAAVDGARLGYGLDEVFVVGVPPAPPAHLGLATAGNDRPRRLVPAQRTAGDLSQRVKNELKRTLTDKIKSFLTLHSDFLTKNNHPENMKLDQNKW